MQNPTDQAEASIPTAETVVREGPPNLNRTAFTVHRKAAKRSERWYQNTAATPLSLPVRKKPRLEEPILPPSTTTDEAAGKATSPEISEGLSPPVVDNDNNESNAESVTDSTRPNAGATGRLRWTPEEDAQLTIAVANTCKKKGGEQKQTDWVAITELVPGRTKKQCIRRWKYHLDNGIDRANERTGKWSGEENNTLKGAVQRYGGKNWGAVAELVPGRTRTQCFNRWHYVLDPNRR
jgi:hypothetical protein